MCLDRQLAEMKRKLSDAIVDQDLLKSELKVQADKHAKDLEMRLRTQEQEAQQKLEDVKRWLKKDVDGTSAEAQKEKAIVEKREEEVERLKEKVRQLNHQVEEMREKETQYCANILTAEDKAKKLRRTLDELTVQATRAAVERTNALKERDKALLDREEQEKRLKEGAQQRRRRSELRERESISAYGSGTCTKRSLDKNTLDMRTRLEKQIEDKRVQRCIKRCIRSLMVERKTGKVDGLLHPITKAREVRVAARRGTERTQRENQKKFDRQRRPARMNVLGELVVIKKTQFRVGQKPRAKYLGPYRVVTSLRND